MSEDVASLKAKLATYAEQLEQVEALLAGDPTNEPFLKLRQDLVEVTKLTEDLLKYKHSTTTTTTSGQQQQQQASEAGVTTNTNLTSEGSQQDEETMEVASFQVGRRCEATYQGKWYPAVITAIPAPNERYAVIYIGFGNSEEVGRDGIRPLTSDAPLDPSTLTAGVECSARYSGDGKYYDAVVDEETDFGYKVTFTDYGNQEELPLEYIRERDAMRAEDADGTELTRAADGSYRIPEHLRLAPTDSDAERLRKRRRVKALKQKIKQQELDDARDAQQDSWRSFQNKGAKRKVAGSLKGLRKESIFKAPDTVDGKVGVTGSGHSMTEYGERKKFKFRDGPPDLG